MKLFLCLFVLFTAHTGYAQMNRQEIEALNNFELPEGSISRHFIFSLDRGNKLELELGNINDLEYLRAMDSILRVFLDDLETAKLKPAGNEGSRRIQYIIDTSANRLRVSDLPVPGSSYLIRNNAIARLKTT